MPWDSSVSGGFTTGRPWLPLGADHEEVNVAVLEKEETSILHLYRKLIELRRRRPTLVSGKMQLVSADNGVLRYERKGKQDRILVLLNMTANSVRTSVERGSILACTGFDREGQQVNGIVEMDAAEGVVIELDS